MGNKPNTTKCFFDIQIGSGQIQTIKFNLYTKDCPKTTNNFIQLCKGHKNYCFGGTNFHRCVKGFIIQGGDVTSGDGSGGISIYGQYFKDENLKLKHTKRGILSMANKGKDTNSSQFFITYRPCPELDGMHVVFGEVYEGFDVLDLMESVSSELGDPTQNIQIIKSGII